MIIDLKLGLLRAEMEDFVGLSFDTISSVGSHAAINHYSPNLETDRHLTTKEIYLVDSGGQYKVNQRAKVISLEAIVYSKRVSS